MRVGADGRRGCWPEEGGYVLYRRKDTKDRKGRKDRYVGKGMRKEDPSRTG